MDGRVAMVEQLLRRARARRPGLGSLTGRSGIIVAEYQNILYIYIYRYACFLCLSIYIYIYIYMEGPPFQSDKGELLSHRLSPLFPMHRAGRGGIANPLWDRKRARGRGQALKVDGEAEEGMRGGRGEGIGNNGEEACHGEGTLRASADTDRVRGWRFAV